MTPTAIAPDASLLGPVLDRPMPGSDIRSHRLRLADDLDVDYAEYTERRRRPRTVTERTVKLYDPTSGRYFAGHTCDVSETGLRLELPAKLPARAGATACVYIAPAIAGGAFISHTQMLPVRYVWVRRDPRTGRATCGVQILADTASQRDAA